MGVLFRIEPRPDAGRAYALVGEMDISNAAELEEALKPVLTETGDVILDLSELRFLDSTGMRTLLQAAGSLGDRGRLILRSPTSSVRRLIELMGVEKMENLQVQAD
jgi:anti-sigma B factor antagonist